MQFLSSKLRFLYSKICIAKQNTLAEYETIFYLTIMYKLLSNQFYCNSCKQYQFDEHCFTPYHKTYLHADARTTSIR